MPEVTVHLTLWHFAGGLGPYPLSSQGTLCPGSLGDPTLWHSGLGTWAIPPFVAPASLGLCLPEVIVHLTLWYDGRGLGPYPFAAGTCAKQQEKENKEPVAPLSSVPPPFCSTTLDIGADRIFENFFLILCVPLGIFF